MDWGAIIENTLRGVFGETMIYFALAALGFCVLTLRSARFAEYFVPFSVAAFATASRFIAAACARFSRVVAVGFHCFIYRHTLQPLRKRGALSQPHFEQKPAADGLAYHRIGLANGLPFDILLRWELFP